MNTTLLREKTFKRHYGSSGHDWRDRGHATGTSLVVGKVSKEENPPYFYK
jgi:hypothetical protein